LHYIQYGIIAASRVLIISSLARLRRKQFSIR
jgi:hypothetical protein